MQIAPTLINTIEAAYQICGHALLGGREKALHETVD